VPIESADANKRLVTPITPNAAPVFRHVVAECFLGSINLLADIASGVAQMSMKVIHAAGAIEVRLFAHGANKLPVNFGIFSRRRLSSRSPDGN
jgi:hypothetical protein